MPYDLRVRGPAIKGATVAGAAATLVLFAWLAGRTGTLRPAADARAGAAWVLLSSGPWALGWLAAASGLGWPIRRMFLRRGGYALQFCLGVAAMMTAEAGLGALGLLQPAGGLGAWALVLAGFALLLVQLRREGPPRVALPWTAWTAAPAVAVLIVAACSAPGWLWSTEFGGYDALSYHLQLPKEWLAIGAIRPLPHNVYSWLPGYVEAAYYHLAVLMGDGLGALYACQLLHAGLTIASAAVAGLFAARLVGGAAAGLSAALMLGTPWAVVVGSLAYNEMAVALFLAGGLLLLDNDISQRGRAILTGALAAAACGAKLTSAGFVAAPLAILLALGAPPRRWPMLAAAAAAAGALVLVPWLARNAAHCGNPLFPFATDLLGTAHWTQEQAGTWRQGHQPPGGSGARLAALWAQLLRYGLGPNPDPPEPWLPQWSLLPWLALAGLAGGAACGTGPKRWPARLGMVLTVQVLFWLTMTHLKSRFMAPALVPMALAAGLGLGAIQSRLRWRALTAGLAAAAFLWCCLPAAIFLRERSGVPAAMIGWADVLAGDGVEASMRRELAREFPAVYVNTMPPGSRTLLLGEAAPLYYRGNVTYQTTWDRGPMSEAMRESPDQPREWLALLRRQGYTHLLVDPHMLARWANDKWNDPLLTPERVLGALELNAQLDHEFPGSVRLYRLPDGS